MSVLSSLSRASDTYSALRLLRLITTPWKKMNAYKHGIIDDKGKRNKDTAITQDIKQYYTLFHRLAFNLKRLIEKVPVIGRRTVTSYAAALLLLKEAVDYKGTDIEFIVEMFGDEKEILLDELNEMMTDSLLLSEGISDDVWLLHEGDRLVFPLVEKSGTDELSVVSTQGSSFMGIPMIKVLYEEEGGQTVTASIAPIIDRPLFSKTDSSVMRRRISIFDLDPEEYEHYTIRHHGEKWNEKYRHNEKLKRAWRREDLVFLRNKGTGTICSIGRANKPVFSEEKEEQTNEMKTNNGNKKYSLNEIKELLYYQKPLNEEDDVLIESILEENDSLIRALDELHAFIDEENDDADSDDERLESIVRETAEKYGVDEKVLDEMFFDELSIEDDDDDDDSILDESNELQKMRDLFNNYRKALEVMHKIVMDNLNDQGKPNKTLDFFAQKADNQIKGKYDSKKLASLYKEKYIDKGTGRVKKTPLSEGTLSDKEFDDLMAQIMDGRLGDDLIDAMEEGDRKSMHRIIDAVINDDKKSKQIVDRILKSQK